jgi:hypothetical protein
MSILCISDGLGVDSKLCPKWPTILSLLLNKKIVNKSIVGAGNEIMLMVLMSELENKLYDHVIIQWTMPRRLDVLCDDRWADIAKKDSVYNFNLHNIDGNTWWSSSASKAKEVEQYKSLLVWDQFRLRSYTHMLAACYLLENHSIPYTFTLSYNLDIPKELAFKNWAWHEENKGMRSYSTISKFSSYDDPACPRPHPLVHLDWLKNILIPAINESLNEKKFSNLELSMIERTKNNLILQK